MAKGKSKTILVVEDDLEVLNLIAFILRRAGYEVIVAKTGEEGVTQTSMMAPDLVLMDVMLPGIDGFEATKRIRRLPEGRNLPIVFLSALGDVESKVKGLRAGGDDYVAKPIKAGDLLARVEARLMTGAPAEGQLISVFGSKAGVGTTTVAVNLALALRRVSQRDVLLLDWRRPLGDVAYLLNYREMPILDALLAKVKNLDEGMFASSLKEFSPGVDVLLGATAWESADRMGWDALHRILGVAMDRADYVLADMGPFATWGDLTPITNEGMSLCVLTPELVSVKRAAGAIDALLRAEYDCWPILNRSDVPGCLSRSGVEQRLGTLLKGHVPDDPEVVTRALNQAQPAYVASPTSVFSLAIEDIATQVHEALS
jgi:pilus assembly protein CpaE